MGNRIHLLQAASTIAVISIMLEIASAQTTQPTGPMFDVPNFNGMSSQQAKAEFSAARNSYRKVVDTLASQLGDINADPFARGCAAYAIGKLRGDIVASALMRFIDLQAPWTGPDKHPTPWGEYPAEEALERIGQPAFEDALNDCEIEDNLTRRKLICAILLRVGHPEAARLRLTEHMDETRDAAKKRRIQACLDLVADPRDIDKTAPPITASGILSVGPIQSGTAAFEIPEFRGMKYEQALAEIWSVDNAFGQVVDRLIAQLDDANATPMARGCSACTLKLLRAEKAVPRLIQMIDFQATWQGRGGASALWNTRYPCAEALRGVGTPSFEAAIVACQTEDNPVRIGLLVQVLYGTEGVDVARMRLGTMAESAGDPTKRRIQGCIDLIDKMFPPIPSH